MAIFPPWVDSCGKGSLILRDILTRSFASRFLVNKNFFLAVRGFIGHFEESGLIPVPHVERCYLWSSLHFTFTYNSASNMIVSVNVSTAGTHPISLDDHDAPLNVEFYYSTEWIETSETISSREKQKGSFFGTNILPLWCLAGRANISSKSYVLCIQLKWHLI